MKQERLVDVDVVLRAVTDKAWKVESIDSGKTAWVPKSQAELEESTLTLPEWLATEKELI